MKVQITATGRYLPPRIETSAELASRIGRSKRWIDGRTGVLERHIADEPMEVLAARAARDAIGDGPPPDLILNASTTPIQAIPDSSVFIQRELGYSGIPSWSVHATCLSFLVALYSAACLVEAGAFRRVLLVSSELGSIARDFDEPESAALLGDAAAAAIVELTPAGESSEIIGWAMSTFPEGAELAELRGAGSRQHPNDPTTRPHDNLFHMNGPGIYRMARRRVGEMLDRLHEEAGIGPRDIDLVVPHQASGPALQAIAHYGYSMDRVVNVVGKVGNCIAASLPYALATAHAEGRISRGDRLLLVGTGAGLSVAAVLLRW